VFKWVGIALGTLVVLLIAFVVGMSLAPEGFREGSRDIFIMIFAVFQLISSIVLIALLVGLLYVINQLNKLARTNVIPKVDNAMLKINDILETTRSLATNVSEAASTATTSTTFVAERVVSPIIRISSLVTGVRAAAITLARRDAPNQLDS
jgi:hypothetical protein